MDTPATLTELFYRAAAAICEDPDPAALKFLAQAVHEVPFPKYRTTAERKALSALLTKMQKFVELTIDTYDPTLYG